MDKLEQLKTMLKDLSPEEVEEVKNMINSTSADETPIEDIPKTDEVSEQRSEDSAEEKSESIPAVDSDDKKEETTSAEEASTEDPTKEEEKAEEIPAETLTDGEDPSEEEAKEETSTTTSDEDDDIPKMQKGISISEEVDAGSPQNVTAETGEDIPVDYEQIVEGLNAKIAALEAENASLKNKVDGAFGYSAKASMPAKVNRLYDECSDVHFHK